MQPGEVLSIIGVGLSVVALALAAKWNRTTDRALGRLETATADLKSVSEQAARELIALRTTVGQIDQIRKALGHAAMAASPESLVILLLGDGAQGVPAGVLAEFGKPRGYGELVIFEAIDALEQQGIVSFASPLNAKTIVTLCSYHRATS